MLDLAIIGAGLSGLALADRMRQGQSRIAVFEAQRRCGGRIQSRALPTADFSVDLGPTWCWPEEQPHIAALVKRLGLELYRQWDTGHSLYQTDVAAAPALYSDTETYYTARKIKGGCRQLIKGLLKDLPDAMLHTQHRLLKLSDHASYIELEFATETGLQHYQAKQVVLAAPPRLLANTVTFEPELAPKLQLLMQETPTWMAGHAKAVLVYPNAFWRRQGFSGNALLPYPGAVLSEVYDACSVQGETAALFGFFGIAAASRERYRGSLEDLVVQQMTHLFGVAAAQPLSVIIQDWSLETFTATEQDHILPNSHPQYGHQWLGLDHWQDKLYFCGTETSAVAGGHLEGALAASERVFMALQNR
jgi:monoamine oxidase